MPRHSVWPLILLVLSCSPYDTAGSRTYVGFSIGVSNAPPPPRVVFVERPDVVIVPGTSVYVVENTDYDVFQYGGSYYLSSGGYWYRSRSYNQPFAVVDVRSVPSAVLTVPSGNWRHHPRGGRRG